ncbi:MAG: VWA domain-containing protein [Oscillospiraceae bacterium]|nr:VWA domain-containing protein [Oscillospiraceae bacterium]
MPEEINFDVNFKTEKFARRQLTLFLMIDCSSSMEGGRIGSVNETMKELLPELVEMEDANVELRLAILTFATECQWVTPMPMSPEKMAANGWSYLSADGLTYFGEACMELSRKMSRKESGFMKSASSSFQPVVILLTDGEPIDNYKPGLEALWKNSWFKNAMRLALPIDDQCRLDVLEEFTGKKEAVLKPVTRASGLRRMLKTIVIESATIGSQSGSISDGDKYTTLVETVTDVQEEIQPDPVPSGNSDPDPATGAGAATGSDFDWGDWGDDKDSDQDSDWD